MSSTAIALCSVIAIGAVLLGVLVGLALASLLSQVELPDPTETNEDLI